MSITSTHRVSSRGFSILELIIAMAIGLLIVALLITVYSRSASTNAEFQRNNSQIENGRFALQLMQQDLMHAGFWGEHVPTGTVSGTINPCTAWASWTTANKTDVFHLPVQGYNDPATSSDLPTGCGTPLPNLVAGSDVLVVRHAENCLAGVGDCEAVSSDKLYLQVSLCADQTPTYEFGRSDDGATFIRQIKTCTDPAATNPATSLRAGKRKVISNIYYVRSTADGPVLARSEFDEESGAVIARTADTLVENIEYLQVEYLLDDGSRTGSTANDGIADSDYVTCAACTAAQWNQVVAARLSVLARSSSTSPGYSDTKTYYVGNAAAICSTAGSCASKVLDPKYKRHVYSMVVRLVNPSSRKGN